MTRFHFSEKFPKEVHDLLTVIRDGKYCVNTTHDSWAIVKVDCNYMIKLQRLITKEQLFDRLCKVFDSRDFAVLYFLGEEITILAAHPYNCTVVNKKDGEFILTALNQQQTRELFFEPMYTDDYIIFKTEEQALLAQTMLGLS